MSTARVLLVVLSLALFGSCSKDDFDTGIKGEVLYGQGDCMPCGGVGCPEREYDKFNGVLYFVATSDSANWNGRTVTQILLSSPKAKVRRGELSAELSPDTYFVMTANNWGAKQEITIQAGEILQKDFKIWHCTSY